MGNGGVTGWLFLIVIILGVAAFGGGALYDDYNDVSNQLVVAEDVNRQATREMVSCNQNLDQKATDLNQIAELNQNLQIEKAGLAAELEAERKARSVLEAKIEELTQENRSLLEKLNQKDGGRAGVTQLANGNPKAVFQEAKNTQTDQATRTEIVETDTLSQDLISLSMAWALIFSWMLIAVFFIWYIAWKVKSRLGT